jgi:peptidoglycan hydrolase FlgJ
MSSDVSTAQVYTDFQGLAALRGRAREGSPEALEVAAKQFEAYLVQQLLRSGRDASLDEDSVLDNKDNEVYQDLFDKQVSLAVTQGQGLGIADMLIQQVQRTQGGDATGAGGTATGAASGQTAASAAGVAPSGAQSQAATPGTAGALLPMMARLETLAATRQAPDAAPGAATPARFSSAAEFVSALLPDAQKVGAELGVDPRLLIAQAALETGWGKSIIRNSDGTSSHNLFNIKASRGWNGAVASARTVEYENGAMVKVGARFRSYASFADSFRDYLQLLRSNPRYQQALQKTNDPAAYAQSLQAAGYATDPKYADKIMTIYGMDEVASAVG